MVVQKKVGSLPPRGLKNRGNTCFMNAALQCLLSIWDLCSFYKNNVFSRERIASNAFQQLVNEYECSKCCDPKDFIDSIRKKIKLFDGSQQDSHEFLIQFIDLLHSELDSDGGKNKFRSKEEFDKVRRESVIAKTIFFMEKQILTCEACDYSSVTTTHNSTVLVEPRENVQSGINEYYKDIKLTGVEAWVCDMCGEKRGSRKMVEVLAYPEILIVHISRFHPQGWKNTASVEINSTLNFCNRTYDLFGIICQSGNLNGGHYFSEAKRAGVWISYNDEKVTKESNTYDGSHPYIVFYTLN